MTPQALIDELDRLESDLVLLTKLLRPQIDALIRDPRMKSAKQVTVIGHGDSFIAGVAAEMAFATAARVRFQTLHSQYFLDYTNDGAPLPESALVIGISASGNTERTVQAIRAARARGAATLAVTGSTGSAAVDAADRALLAELPDKRPSPGIRTYQASVTALLMLAAAMGGSQHLFLELAQLSSAVGATVRAARACCDTVAASIADTPAIMLAGTGPSHGSALYGAAKIIETTGLPAAGYELEEWWHVPRFQRPSGLVLIVIAAPGRSRPRALELTQRARALGRRVIVVAAKDDAELIAQADAAIPVCGGTSEELSPLLYHIFAGTLAAALASTLGRNPFESAPAPRQAS